ncbi:hypothetical protein [Flexibacterium corallicola]|uniref:hypothetical protein n=1 Tax=Flexibacterium corallicola TaxID=3037259 RepID=UPI00286FACC1|nr:hypothetical protein [Pseudovibrio sp. M1P-2-3]
MELAIAIAIVPAMVQGAGDNQGIDMINLSTLENHKIIDTPFVCIDRNNNKYGVWSVNIDTGDPIQLLDNLRSQDDHRLGEIGIILQLEDGDFPDDWLDAVIYMSQHDINTIVEVPSELLLEDYQYSMILDTLSNLDVSISFLPPDSTTDDEAFQAYLQRIVKLCELYTERKQFSCELIPITSYLEYLPIEILLGDRSDTYKPKNPYVLNAYHNVLPVHLSDELKATMKPLLFDIGGNLNKVVHHTVNIITEALIADLKEQAEQPEVIDNLKQIISNIDATK